MSVRANNEAEEGSIPGPTQTNSNNATTELRITPRNSDTGAAFVPSKDKDTPWRTLNRLANIPRTPLRRASSVGFPSAQKSNRSKPGARTPAAAQTLGSARRKVAITPHGRAAQRELELRRAGATPGKDRRRSGRQQRETPRDTLRLLSRIMGPKTLPVVPTPQGPDASTHRVLRPGFDDLDDDPALERPRLSLPLGDDDEDDSLLLPPRSAGLEDENFTIQSVELGRRAISEQPGRLSRGSFGSIGIGDAFADLDEMGPGNTFDSSIMAAGFEDVEPSMADDGLPLDENTGPLRGFGFDQGRLSLAAGQESDIGPGVIPGDDTETTFYFTVPPRDSTGQPSQQFRDGPGSPIESLSEADADEELAEEANLGDDNGLDPTLSLSPEGVNGDMSAQERTVHDAVATSMSVHKIARKKKIKVSKYNIQYPSLPTGVVKKLATTYARTAGNSKAKITKETLEAIMQASDWFFEQISDDLGAYAKHAGRKTINESDAITLMSRQRQTTASTTPFSLAQKYLPRELLQEMRMTPPSALKRKKHLQTIEEAEE